MRTSGRACTKMDQVHYEQNYFERVLYLITNQVCNYIANNNWVIDGVAEYDPHWYAHMTNSSRIMNSFINYVWIVVNGPGLMNISDQHIESKFEWASKFHCPLVTPASPLIIDIHTCIYIYKIWSWNCWYTY